MRIKMIVSTMGSENGLHSKRYLAGEEYDINESLANVFVKQMKVAIEVVDEIETEKKALVAAPENKAAKVNKIDDEESKIKRGKKDR